MTEEERYGGILEKIEEKGQRWIRERIGIYGQAIVANTLLLSKISHRAQVDTLSAQVRKGSRRSSDPSCGRRARGGW